MGGPDKDARFNDVFEACETVKPFRVFAVTEAISVLVGRQCDLCQCQCQVELDPDGVVSYWKKDKEALSASIAHARPIRPIHLSIYLILFDSI